MVAARLLGRALSVGGTATSAAVLAWASSGPSTSQLSKNAAAPTQSTMPVGQPGVELLVHNISHSDMVVALQEVAHGSDGLPLGAQGDVLARPVFNSFMPVSMAIMERLEQILASGGQPTVLKCLSQYRVEYPTGLDLTGGMDEGLVITRSGHEHNHDSRQPDFGSCTSLSETNISDPWKLFNIKGLKELDRAAQIPQDAEHSDVRVAAVYLPLLAAVIPEWIRAMKRRAVQLPSGTPPPRKVLVLVSGAGQPRNERANPADNSTEGTGRIIERFVKLVHPDIEVVHIPSSFGIFRYDDNVRFVKEQVLPVVEAKRAEVVSAHGDQWAHFLKVTVCLADGAPARISAVNAAMRSYRPDYLHVWRTKTFWDTRMLSEEDVESHTFKKLEMRPATHRSQLGPDDKGLVDEMVRYKRQFEAVRDSDTHELTTFWLRKTGKAVLAVLLTRSPDGKVTYWRGLNLEVSMPTGTLCAERNAIGNALAADQAVHRRDMLGVAVLSVPLDRAAEVKAMERTRGELVPMSSEAAETALNPLDPCGACMEWLKKISEVNPDFKVLTFTSTSCEKIFVTPIGDYG